MTTTSAITQRKAEAPDSAAQGRWLMLVVLLTGQFMALLDVTIVNVAMPTIGRDLHASGAALQLVVSGYAISYAMLLITGARLGDLFGRRRLFLAGLAGFTVSSLACGIAPDMAVLVTARFTQGAAAAMMMPQIISVIQAQFAGAARAKALSAYSAVLAVGFVAGQVLGGVLVSANLFGSGWRPVFLVNVPIGLAVAALVPHVVPRDGARGNSRLDLAGLAIAVPAVFLVVLPLVLGHQEGWPAWTFVSMAAGLVLAAVFVTVERRVAARGGDPLLKLAVLRAPGITSGLSSLALAMITYGGFLFSLALHLQAGLGDSALRAGLTFAPAAAAFGLCGFYWRKLPVRIHHALTAGGFFVGALGYLALALDLRSGSHGGPQLVVILVVIGAGFGVGYSPLVTHSLVHVPLHDAADASGLLTTSLQLGQVIGVATFGSLFLTLATHPQQHASAHAIAVTAGLLALLLLAGSLAAVPLARAVLRTRRTAAPVAQPAPQPVAQPASQRQLRLTEVPREQGEQARA
jgi:MFS family permease